MSDVVELSNYINGEWRSAICEHWIEDYSPANGSLIAQIPCSSSEDVDEAVLAASEAIEDWANLTIAERADWLEKIADALESRAEEVAQLESLDTGKPITLARSVDAARSVANFRFFAEQGREFESEIFEMSDATNRVVYKPVGVTGLITPWNLPLYLLSWKVAPALLMGNTVVAKPSEMTPMTASLLAEVMEDVELPIGVFNLVHGNGLDAGAPLTSHPDVNLISFTGGTATGREVAKSASSGFKKLSLELGGKNATIIRADADLDEMMPSIVRASFLNQGQVCLCGSRILIHESIYDSFVKGFLEVVSDMIVGDPSDDQTELGALISADHRDKVMSYIELAEEEGGDILCGGGAPVGIPQAFENGYWVSPTVIDGLAPDSRCATEEIFGPVVTLHPFSDDDEAVEIANMTDYGLAGSIWTQDVDAGGLMAERIESGMVWVNCWLHRDLRVPFGGVKNSGVGREGGRWSLGFFSEAINICIKH
ncbi:MAG: 2-hydroxymuconic semialdehyde dehydrogenase [Marine Group II euryarchaeote MED-G33]|nr:MAG: 2-hydroxymuconic semialdehyde dehydrogenase [Marine Group II euryarchaeote MED-G33]